MDQWLEKTPLLGDVELREIGNIICKKRTARGWTQNDLAGYLGSDYRVVSRHENGHGMNLESLQSSDRTYHPNYWMYLRRWLFFLWNSRIK